MQRRDPILLVVILICMSTCLFFITEHQVSAAPDTNLLLQKTPIISSQSTATQPSLVAPTGSLDSTIIAAIIGLVGVLVGVLVGGTGATAVAILAQSFLVLLGYLRLRLPE